MWSTAYFLPPQNRFDSWHHEELYAMQLCRYQCCNHSSKLESFEQKFSPPTSFLPTISNLHCETQETYPKRILKTKHAQRSSAPDRRLRIPSSLLSLLPHGPPARLSLPLPQLSLHSPLLLNLPLHSLSLFRILFVPLTSL